MNAIIIARPARHEGGYLISSPGKTASSNDREVKLPDETQQESNPQLCIFCKAHFGKPF